MVNLLYVLISLIIISIIIVYVYKPDKNRIIIIPRGNFFSVTTYCNGLLTNIQLVHSRIINQWFEAYKKPGNIKEEDLEIDLLSGKPIEKKKRGRPRKIKTSNGYIII